MPHIRVLGHMHIWIYRNLWIINFVTVTFTMSCLSDPICSFRFICRPLKVSLSMAGIMAADSVSHTLQVQQWDGEVRQESRHAADLKQLDNGVKIPPR